MTPTIETVLNQVNQLPVKERRKLPDILSRDLTLPQEAGGNSKADHFQETASEEKWKEALFQLANEPRIDAPDIPDEALRRENL